MNKKFILFDFDNTLIDAETAYRSSLKKLSLSKTKQIYARSRALIKNELHGNPSSHSRLLYFKDMLDSTNRFSAKNLLSMLSRYEAELQKQYNTQWKQLKRSSLMSKLGKKYNLGIITNENTRTQLLKLHSIDPKSDFFSFIVTSEEVGVEKPHAKIFTKALRLAKKTNPGLKNKDIFLIGDSLNDDIEPALKLGLKAIHTSQFQKPSNAGKMWLKKKRVLSLQNLEDLLKII